MIHDKQPWNNHEANLALELHLANASFISERECFLKILGRSWAACDAFIWKMKVNYPRPAVREYIAQDRTKRKGAFSQKEKMFIVGACSPVGKEYNAFKVDRLATLLARPPAKVDKQMEKMAAAVGLKLLKFNGDGERADAIFRNEHHAYKKYLIRRKDITEREKNLADPGLSLSGVPVIFRPR